MFERFRLSNLSKSYRQRGASSELARDKKQQRQQCVTVLFLDDITHTFRIEVSTVETLLAKLGINSR